VDSFLQHEHLVYPALCNPRGRKICSTCNNHNTNKQQQQPHVSDTREQIQVSLAFIQHNSTAGNTKQTKKCSSLRFQRGETAPRIAPLGSIFSCVVVGFFLTLFFYIKSLDNLVHHEEKREREHAFLTGQSQHDLQHQISSVTSTLVLTTKLGDINIKLRDDLSKESSDYLRQIVQSGSCPRCSIYRVQDKGGIVQGIIRNPELANEIAVPLGDCPPDVEEELKRGNCHGPLMKNGMVGWAGGQIRT
jgi:hypothetical protein